jgi:tRNA pseudouridine55 synthase
MNRMTDRHSTNGVQDVGSDQRKKVAWRDITGIVILDKRSGITSNKALQEVRRLFNARKAGHTGSLDPLATGVLPICFGEATKLSGLLLESEKVYEVSGRLGMSTDTGDSTGVEAARADWSGIDVEQLEKVLERFRGEIEQIPPMYSALKHQGERLYKIARSGQTVERPPRKVTIHKLEILAFKKPDFELRVGCSKGTYVRTLIEDIAVALGSLAHVTALRRIAAGPFGIESAISVEKLRDAAGLSQQAVDNHKLDAEVAVEGYPAVHFAADETRRLLHGQRIRSEQSDESGMVRLYGPGDRFLGMGEIQTSGMIAPKRLFQSDT